MANRTIADQSHRIDSQSSSMLLSVMCPDIVLPKLLAWQKKYFNQFMLFSLVKHSGVICFFAVFNKKNSKVFAN